MKDNKYQEYMSHITLTPEMKERVMGAIEEEIEEIEAMDGRVPGADFTDINDEPAREDVKIMAAGKAGRRRSFLRYASCNHLRNPA